MSCSRLRVSVLALVCLAARGVAHVGAAPEMVAAVMLAKAGGALLLHSTWRHPAMLAERRPAGPAGPLCLPVNNDAAGFRWWRWFGLGMDRYFDVTGGDAEGNQFAFDHFGLAMLRFRIGRDRDRVVS